MHLYDLLQDLEINIDQQYRNIIELITKKDLQHIGSGLCDLISIINSFFLQLDVRSIYINFEQLSTSLDISLSISYISDEIYEIDKFILLSEFLLTIFKQKEGLYPGDYYIHDTAEQRINVIKLNIEQIITSLNYKIYTKNNHIYIVLKSAEVDQTIHLIEEKDKDIAIELLHYNNHDLVGNIKEKKKILKLLADHIEPILNENILFNNGYKDLHNDIGFCLNNLNIRHNNLAGKKLNQYCVDIHEKNELEQWYDNTYNSILMVIIAKKQIEYKKEISELKTQYNL